MVELLNNHYAEGRDLGSMIAQETRILIRHYVQNGETKSEVARRLGVSRQTVYNHLHRQEKPRGKRASKLDAYKDYIDRKLKEFSIPATVLLGELRERGYDGGITILKDYIHDLRKQQVSKITRRFETEPGRQAQIDWGECGSIVVDGVRRQLYVFVFVLGFSRMLFARFTTSTRSEVLQRCMAEAFERLGICREVVVDNMKQAVLSNTPAGVRFAPKFLDFCEHYEVRPIATPPYWPRSKGKVERGVGYIKNSFLEGRSFTDLRDLNEQLDHWLDTVANVRVHGTTARVPAEVWQQESLSLRTYASFPVYDTRASHLRKVQRDGHIRYEGVFYSVDLGAIGTMVVVRPSGEQVGDLLEMYLGADLVAAHRRADSRRTRRVTLEGHQQQIIAATKGRRGVRGRAVRFRQLGAGGEARIESPEVQTRSLELYEQLSGAR
jgi:transposase